MITWKIPKSNISSGATPAAKSAPNSVPQINLVDVRKDTQNTSLAQVIPIRQPVLPLSLMPAPLAANPPVHLVESVTFSMENPNMTAAFVLSF
jgi:hypothetical protein